MPGRLITFEGPEGSGKTTQAALLAERLEQAGEQVLRVREPGGTALGEAIRDLLQHDAAGEPPCDRAEALLFAAARAELTTRVILPALEEGVWVICDRFIDSTLAYQGFGRGMDLEALVRLNAFATRGRKPDLTLLLDIEVEEGFRRLARRPGRPDRFEREAQDFHRRVREGYLRLAALEPDRFERIDASGPPEEVAEAVWKAVAKLRAAE